MIVRAVNALLRWIKISRGVGFNMLNSVFHRDQSFTNNETACIGGLAFGYSDCGVLSLSTWMWLGMWLEQTIMPALLGFQASGQLSRQNTLYSMGKFAYGVDFLELI